MPPTSIPILKAKKIDFIDVSIRKSTNSNCHDGDVLNESNNNIQLKLEKSIPSSVLVAEDIDIISDFFPPLRIVWRNVVVFAYLHLAAAYGGFLVLTGHVMWQTVIWVCLGVVCGIIGTTAGAHRLWSHRSYKAKAPLKILLVFMQTIAFQNSVHEWCRDHRVHHKYAETHADPHNAKRGFWFAHMGWLCCRKHEAVKLKGKQIDMSDLEADPILMFQKKYYILLVLMCSLILSTIVPWYLWGEDFATSLCFATLFRYCYNLHVTWFVNSAAHLWGSKPYDKTINPAQNKIVSILSFGEGWHNYHHVFPWDYKTAELGRYKHNFTTAFIDFFAWIGWAYDLKTVPEKIVQQRVTRTGDGSHSHYQRGHFESGPWGWGDKDIPKEDFDVTETLHTLLREE